MKKLKLENYGLSDLSNDATEEINGGFLPLAVVVGIWAFQGACCIVALGMKARLEQEQN